MTQEFGIGMADCLKEEDKILDKERFAGVPARLELERAGRGLGKIVK